MSARPVRKILLTGAIVLTLFASGCSYYRVTDATSGRSYYTRWIERNTRTNMVDFTDAKTGMEVTLAATNIKKITKEEYKAAVEGDGTTD